MEPAGVGTKAQQALQLMREQTKNQRKTESRRQRLAEKQRRFELKQLKRKQKHRGRQLLCFFVASPEGLPAILANIAGRFHRYNRKNEEMDMEKKRVLIYGDSNTHGFRVSDGLRYDKNHRWTGICQNLTEKYIDILEEGLNGRTTCVDEPGMEFRNGLAYIQPCIRTHLPLDLICVMVGSNDLKAVFGRSAEEIAESAGEILNRARWVTESKYPESPCQYLLMAPIEVGEALLSGPFGWEFEGAKTIEKSKSFADAYRAVAEKNGFLFFDAAKYAEPGRIDGLHLDEENHRKLGEAFAAWLCDWAAASGLTDG